MKTDRHNYSLAWARQVAYNLELVRREPPLVYAITNFVTMNDVANCLLALGASPVMAQAPQEVEDIVQACQTILVNLGTLTSERFELILNVVTMAEKYAKGIVLDPVGAGGTGFRTAAARQVLSRKPVSLLRSNLGEAAALAGVINSARIRGVDSVPAHEEGTKDDHNAAQVALALARQYSHLSVAITGPRDWVADRERLLAVDNGVALLRQVSGAGCMLGGICAAFGSLVDPVEAAVSALAVFGIAAELANQKAPGPGSLRMYLLDALFNLTSEQIIEDARIIEIKVEQACK